MSDIFNLADLSPREATFELAAMPNQKLTLCKWSLRIRAWAQAKYTPQGLNEIFVKQKLTEIAEMAFFMLKEKSLFADQDAFFDAICTTKDQINLIMAMLETIGIGEPEIKKIQSNLPKETPPPDPNAVAPVPPKKVKTGVKHSTK
jgi:hypothetical protein